MHANLLCVNTDALMHTATRFFFGDMRTIHNTTTHRGIFNLTYSNVHILLVHMLPRDSMSMDISFLTLNRRQIFK